MSQENVEIVRRSMELWNEGDLAAFVALHHPDVVVVPPDTRPDGEVSRGREAWLRQGMRIKDSWESDRVELDHLAVNLLRLGDKRRVILRGAGAGRDQKA